MKTCSELRHLEQFGIKLLTGEADALGFRILCDLDEQGVRVFKECFGIPFPVNGQYVKADVGLASNWNSGSIASVMLTGHELVPLAIMGFYLQGYDVIVTRSDKGWEAVMALEEDENVVLAEPETNPHYRLQRQGGDFKWPPYYGEICRIIRQKRSDGRIVQGTRNVHQMSGRVS